MQKIKKIIAKIKNWLTDHYHILFKSAAENHLRIQELAKNADGTYQLTVKFGSYSELKNYQKKMRRLTVSLSSAMAMVIVAFIVAPYVMNPSRSSAANFLWSQSSWSGTAAATSTTNKTTWTGYVSKDVNINATAVTTADHTANTLSLTLPTAATTGEAKVIDVGHDSTFAANLAANPNAGFYTDASGNLTLKRLDGANCTNADQCVSAFCSSIGNVCGHVTIVWLTTTTTSGALGGRSGADAICAADAGRPDATNIKAFLSASPTDTIASMAGTSYPAATPIFWYKKTPVTFTLLANNWADMLDGSIINAGSATGFISSYIYSFSTSTGTLAGSICGTYNCSCGTASAGNGYTFNNANTDASWIATIKTNSCVQTSSKIMCIGTF
ncbi:MAG: hypothetical protein HGA36_01530 [Candidatus Moranbacteria bacterium]|nr:hypothetical protein [Candidatus Moranbacteria bacterium]